MLGCPRRPAVTMRFAAAFLAASLCCLSPAAAAGIEQQAAAWAAGDAAILARAAPRLADAAVSRPFVAMDGRIGAYADWVYGWLSSLLTAWDLAYAGAVETGREIAAGRVPSPGLLREDMAGLVQERFESTVIMPVRTNDALVEGWRRAMTRLSEFDVRLAAARRQRIERAAAFARIDPAPALRAYGAPLLSATIVDSTPPAELADAALGRIGAGAGGTADDVLVRSLRPLATRAISVTTRLLLLPVAGGVLTLPAIGVNGVGTALAAMTAVWAGVWGMDYSLNAMDSALRRPAFERSLRRLVKDVRIEASGLARRQAATVTCAALAEPSRSNVAACAGAPGIAMPGIAKRGIAKPGVAVQAHSG